MESPTYSLYELCKKLYENVEKHYQYDENPDDVPDFDKFYDTKKKQLHRFIGSLGISRFQLSQYNDGIYTFDEESKILVLFIFENYTEPFFKKVRLLNNPDPDEIKSINEIFKEFLFSHFENYPNPVEIRRRFKDLTQFDLYEISEKLIGTYSDDSDIIRKYVNYIIPVVTKESRKKMKKLNKEFSHADNSILLNEIIEKNIDTSDLMSSTNPYPNSSYQIQPYFDQLIQLCGYDIMLQEAVKNSDSTSIRRIIVKTSENWMKVVGIYIEIRDEEISDISFESVDNHLSNEENYEALLNNTTPPLDLFLLAKKEFEEAEINREVCIQRAKNNDNIPPLTFEEIFKSPPLS